MTQDEIIEMARQAGLHLYVNDIIEKPYAEIVVAFANLVAAKEREALAQPEQEPVIGTKTWFEDGKVVTQYLYPSDIYTTPPQPEQEPVVQYIGVYTAPPQRKPLPPQSPCEMTQAEGKMFKLGWLECEAAHGIKE